MSRISLHFTGSQQRNVIQKGLESSPVATICKGTHNIVHFDLSELQGHTMEALCSCAGCVPISVKENTP